MNKQLEELRKALRARADVNKDGKLDKLDIEQVISPFRHRIESSAQKRPWGTIGIACALTCIFTSMLWAIAC